MRLCTGQYPCLVVEVSEKRRISCVAGRRGKSLLKDRPAKTAPVLTALNAHTHGPGTGWVTRPHGFISTTPQEPLRQTLRARSPPNVDGA